MSEALIKKIEAAFAGVPRGSIGIRGASAAACDWDTEAPDLFKAACRADIETDWRDIPEEAFLAADPHMFGYLGGDDFKFLLPALMRWSLQPDYQDSEDIIFYLFMKLVPTNVDRRTGKVPDVKDMLQVFSQEQIEVTWQWLQNYVEKHQETRIVQEGFSQLEAWRVLVQKGSC